MQEKQHAACVHSFDVRGVIPIEECMTKNKQSVVEAIATSSVQQYPTSVDAYREYYVVHVGIVLDAL